MKNHRLTNANIPDLIAFSKQPGFPYVMNEENTPVYCSGKDPCEPCVQTYGVYQDGELVAVMTASYNYVFPHPDSPKGKTVQISGAYTREDMRHQGYGKSLIKAIEKDAREYFDADYLCCDSTASGFYANYGFIKAQKEDRMWISL